MRLLNCNRSCLAAGPAGYAAFLTGVMTMFSYMRHCPNALTVDIDGDTATTEGNSVLYGTMAGTPIRACVHLAGRCVRVPSGGANPTGWKFDNLSPTFDFFVSRETLRAVEACTPTLTPPVHINP